MSEIYRESTRADRLARPELTVIGVHHHRHHRHHRLRGNHHHHLLLLLH